MGLGVRLDKGQEIGIRVLPEQKYGRSPISPSLSLPLHVLGWGQGKSYHTCGHRLMGNERVMTKILNLSCRLNNHHPMQMHLIVTN